MAWPPGVLSTSRSNATPQTDTHPADHNAVNGAVNDTVAHVQGIDTQLATTNSSLASLNTEVNAIESGAITVGSATSAASATLAYKVRSVDTANDIEFHWDPPYLYFRVDGDVWNQITSTPV